MKRAYQEQLAARLDVLLTHLPKTRSAALRGFAEKFYASLPPAELAKLAPKEACAMAVEAFGFLEKRPGGAPKIRIFTPSLKEHGWESRRTILQFVNDDMPFLVDSLTAEIGRLGLNIHETLHPIVRVRRNASGTLLALAKGDEAGTFRNESFIHFEVSALPEGLDPEALARGLERVLAHIRAAVEDWQRVVGKVHEAIASLDQPIASLKPEELWEARDFLVWLADRNFVFLGYDETALAGGRGKRMFSPLPETALGILKLPDNDPLPQSRSASPEALIEITKSSQPSAVHRAVPMDCITVRRFDARGKPVGERRFVGLFTSNVYYQSAEQIPFARRKLMHVLAQAGFDPASHDGKALKTILEFLPRDELFQMSEAELFETGIGVLALELKPGVRVFVRRDPYERFASAMIFVPRERFSTELRRQIQHLVEKAYGGSSSVFFTQITESPLARLHLIVKTTPGAVSDVELHGVEAEIAKLAYQWSDLLRDALAAQADEHKAEQLFRRYAQGFPPAYVARYDILSAINDIEKVEEAIASGGPALKLFRLPGETEAFAHLKIYNPVEEIALSEILPVLENSGFRAIDEHPFFISPHEVEGGVWIRDFKLQLPADAALPIEQTRSLLEDMLGRVWRGLVENDKFNALALLAGLSWREASVMRAYAKYLKQTGFLYDPGAIAQALATHPAIARNLADFFLARFDPGLGKNRQKIQERLRADIEAALAKVGALSEDRVLRRYLELIGCTVRTNYFQQDENGAHRPVLSFKFDSRSVPDLPLPRPHAEIFVYSPRVEGIHLRGGKVARGGLRWSDRHDDFRTEILGLMKAQMVKNAVIVPMGSKGGFVVKRPPANPTREAVQEEGIACYKLYLGGLLDLTDTIAHNKVAPPSQMVRHDGDDPYLVVAADKGTASFSDIANGVSAQYGFWLGDAFASGGSAGYDHKKMAITARGAWISVTRHFREMGVDIDAQDFTVAGVGDMSGDVFGNGMLLSERIKLVAAFNHQHIFLDPSPDPKKSFAERKRLFALPRSTWKDYDAKLISKGGGVYERNAKSIALSPEARQALGTEKASVTPDELVRMVLLAPVDLLWNGGIGTYVKAAEETHEQVGDRANNALRVNGRELRCKVVGEGGNLGFTQSGRIEYARNGGRINTDAIDNSAGVDCSDHEVNIKIAFAGAMTGGSLTTAKRNHLLAAMTDEVASLVLKDNTLQTQAITIAELQGGALLESQKRLIHQLEREGLLDRAIEFLPSDKALDELKTARKGLTRPELAVLLAYGKLSLYRQILESSLPDEPYFSSDLKRYFPQAMQKQFAHAIEHHRLKREIIATVMTNSIVNRAGITFYSTIAEEMGIPARDAAAAYALVRDVFGLRDMWKQIAQTDAAVSAQTQVEMHTALNRFLMHATTWLLRHQPLPLSIDRLSAALTPMVAEIRKHAERMHSKATRKSANQVRSELEAKGAPTLLAQNIASLELLSSSFDIIKVAQQTELPLPVLGKLYFEIGARLKLGWLRLSAEKLGASSHWERMAIQALTGDLYDEQRRIAGAAGEALCKGDACETAMKAWLAAHGEEVARYDRFIEELQAGEAPDIPRLLVALRQIKALGVG